MNTKDIVMIFLVLIVSLPIVATMIPTGPFNFMMVSGTSMEPTITENDIIVVKETDNGIAKVGDIISYSHFFEDADKRVIVTHRIVEIAEEGYITRGDAYEMADNYIVNPENVRGIMQLKIPYLGGVAKFAAKPTGLIILVIVPALIYIASEIYSMIEYRGN